MFWDPKLVLRGGLDIRQISRLQRPSRRVFSLTVVEGVSLTPSSVASALENFETKALPWSLSISLGSPWCHHTFSKNRQATPSESTEVTVGIAWMCLEVVYYHQDCIISMGFRELTNHIN